MIATLQRGGHSWAAKEAPRVVGGTVQELVQRLTYHRVIGRNCRKSGHYRWISWSILPWKLEGITSPCCLLLGQYPHHMTLCPPVTIVIRCYGIRLFFLLATRSALGLHLWPAPAKRNGF